MGPPYKGPLIDTAKTITIGAAHAAFNAAFAPAHDNDNDNASANHHAEHRHINAHRQWIAEHRSLVLGRLAYSADDHEQRHSDDDVVQRRSRRRIPLHRRDLWRSEPPDLARTNPDAAVVGSVTGTATSEYGYTELLVQASNVTVQGHCES